VRRSLLLVTVTAALIPCSASASAPDLPGYLSTVHPLVIRQTSLLNAAAQAIANTSPTDPAAMRRTAVKVRVYQTKLKNDATVITKIKPPTVLTEPNAALAKSGRLLAKGIGFLADSLDQGGVGIHTAINQFEARARDSTALRRHWRQEVIVALRRAGLSVPFWVTQVAV
jgi:hypothetical protein